MTPTTLTLTLISPETDQAIDHWSSDTLIDHLAKASGTILAHYLPQTALTPLADWGGLPPLITCLSAYTASLTTITSHTQKVRKKHVDMTSADWAELRASVAHTLLSIDGEAAEEWTRIVTETTLSNSADVAAIGDLTTFLQRGISEGALLKNETLLLAEQQEQQEEQALAAAALPTTTVSNEVPQA